MEYLLIAVVLIAVFAFVANPVLKPPEPEYPETDTLDTLATQRDSAYQAIRDLDFDFQLGKISEADYQALRERYKAHAALVLQQIDARAQEKPAPSMPEQSVKMFCTNCGSPREPDDKFCRKCGNKLN